jgi:hypothetical protein
MSFLKYISYYEGSYNEVKVQIFITPPKDAGFLFSHDDGKIRDSWLVRRMGAEGRW